MATRKNNWLNAKPVTKAGGKSGGARNPAKPYNKPASTSGTPKVKTKTQKLQQAAKTKPSSPAPKQVIKKPVTRTGPVKGPVAPKGSTGPITLPNSRKAGVNLPKTGARAERTATAATQPRNAVTPQKPSSRPLTAADGRPVKMDAKGWPKGTESWAANSTKAAPKAAGGLKGAMGRLGRLAGPIGLGITGADLAEQAGFARGGKNYREFTRAQDKPPAKPPKPIKQGDAQSRFAGARDANLNRINNDPRFAAPKPSAKPKPAPTQSGDGSTQTRSSGGGSSRPAAPRPQSGPASNAGMKNQDPKFRGNLFEKTFGYKPGQAPDQQKARFKSVDNKFGQDSGYEPNTKVDGSKYADKKPDMKKVKEYDRLRRKYYD